MKIKYLLVFAIVMLCVACNNNKTIKFEEFPIEEELKGKLVDKKYFLQTSKVYVMNDTIALFYSLYNSNEVFYFVSLNDFSLLNVCGKIGKGPGELINAGYLSKTDDAIWLSDGMKQCIFKYPLKEAIYNENCLPDTSISTQEYGIVTPYIIKNDSLWVYAGETGEHILYKVQGTERVGLGMSHIFDPEDRLTDINRSFELFQKHPEKDLFALVYAWDDVLAIMNTNGEVLKRTEGPDMIQKPMENKENPNYPVKAYAEVHVDSNYIYGLYSGKKRGYSDENGEFVMTEPASIFVFNWKGEPVKKIVLEHPAYSFDLDKAHNRIITYSNYLDEEIVCYDYEFQ